MKKVRIIVDSTADMPESVRAQVTVVPLTIAFGQETFVDGVTINHRRFYEMLVENDVLPTTSQPSPDAFTRLFAAVEAAGEEAVVLTVSSKLSGTYQSAMIAAEDFPGVVHVVDSRTVAIGLGILAERALQLAAEGLSAQELAARLNKEKESVRLVALLDTLEYLKKGGRISKTVAFAGGLLGVKPVIAIREGAVEMLGKARGSKQGNNLLVKEIESAGGVDFHRPLLLGYSGLSDLLLKKYITDSAALWEGQVETLPTAMIGSVVGTHAGPGAVAVAFFAGDR